MTPTRQSADPWVLRRDDLAALMRALRDEGYRLAGPTIRDGAVVYDEIGDLEDLPSGWKDAQAPGRYRLERRNDEALFGYTVGPHSLKKCFLPPMLRLFSARREGDGFVVMTHEPEEPGGRAREMRDDTPPGELALVGVRACDLAAVAVQDRVLRQGEHVDPHYVARREGIFIVAVNCTVPGGTCFCASMDTGPRATQGFDLALTELLTDGEHRFVVEVGSELGSALLSRVEARRASQQDLAAAEAAMVGAASRMGRALDTREIKRLLYESAEHARWDDVANRCLSCANCTMVCPTCFCTTVEDVTDLAGSRAERLRRWESCFATAFTYIHGGSIRPSVRARYRQWMTHKLASWIDQFGTSGCVGCGRCITWCPVGIDITEEAAAMRATMRKTPHSEKQ